MDTPRRGFTKIEVGFFFGIGLVVVAEMLTHFAHWDRRICYAVGILIVGMGLSGVTSGSRKSKVLRAVSVIAVVLFVYFVWR